MSELKNISLEQVRDNPDAIRVVNRKSESYDGIVESIKAKGFIGAITVRPINVEGEDCFVVVDGMHRYMAAKDAGLTEIPCVVCTMDEGSAIETSIMANVHRKDTSASEYRSGLLKILNMAPLMTEAELATKLGKSPTWLSNILRLNKIENDEIMGLIDSGAINLSNAYAIAKLPADEQVNFLTEAQTMSPEEFVPLVSERVKEIKDAKRKGEDPSDVQFSPAEFMQKMSIIKEQRDSGEIGVALVDEAGVSTAVEGFALGLNWALHADAFSVAEQKEAWDQKQAAKAEKKRQSDANKAAKKKAKAEEALKAAAEAEAAIAG